MTDLSVITQLQNAFDQAVGGGFANIQNDVNWVFATITILTLVLTALLTWVWGEVDTLLRALIQRILIIGFVGYLVGNWHSLTMMIVDGLTQLGLKAGGSTQSFSSFLNSPEQIASDGYNLAKNVFAVCKDCSVITNAGWFFIYLAAFAMILLAMFWLAIQVFVTTLEFKLVTLASLIFVPFAVWQKTTFLSDRALGYVFSVGAKLLTLALVVTVGSKFLTTLTVDPTPSLQNVAAVTLAAFTVLILALSAGSLASALVSGGPQLGAGAVVGAAAATAAMGGAAYLGGRSAFQRYSAASRAFSQSGGNVVQRLGAGLKGAAFPGGMPGSGGGMPPSAGVPTSGEAGPPRRPSGGGAAAKVAEAAHVAGRASHTNGASFGSTGMHNKDEGDIP
ncbi:MAG: P-type conjugative transfer protein TrbL [Alphaproteobacteria bacterium 64-11]|nr:MAG: P-type conjugative transfer protein TrbL [Alphaproteobacteria bacterium 64-11]